MSKPRNIIEINGQQYDAKTGSVITGNGKSVDGVLSKRVANTPTAVTAKPKPVLTPIPATKVMDMQAPKRKARSAAKPASSHQPQQSQALMRHAVHKPGNSLKREHAAHGHTDSLVTKPQLTVSPKHSVHSVPAGRLSRAAQFTKSARVSRFVKTQPSAMLAIQQSTAAIAAPSPVLTQPNNMFDSALASATSHLQPPVKASKHPRRQRILGKRVFSIAATAACLLLIAGGVLYYNRTGLALHMAASKAGFSAALPSYRPSGFQVAKLKSSAGQVAIHYASTSDQRTFAVTEQPSSWDSNALLDNFVSTADKQYETIDVGGRTVYLYGKHNAAWVSGGIWYSVQSQGSLSDKQLAQLAASL